MDKSIFTEKRKKFISDRNTTLFSKLKGGLVVPACQETRQGR
jgi:hypothetical protein